MKKTGILYMLSLLSIYSVAQSFLEQQKSYPRVQTAYKEKLSKVETLLMAAKLDLNDLNLFIRIFKQERILEVWGKKKNDSCFSLITTYPLTSLSGLPGPKRRQGDEQMPEGIYKITQYNPQSNYFLSMRINYPNESDLKFADKQKPGNDIFIHGNNVSIGCFSIGDDAIKELYIMAIEANAQSNLPIPVHIFPAKLTESNFYSLCHNYPQHQSFWENLKPIYQYFEEKKMLPLIRINSNGAYEIVK
jgi:murein L,D-transpeptidase YafK